MKDTPEAVDRRYRAMLLALSPGARVSMASKMFAGARALVEAGIRARRPDLAGDEEALRDEVFARVYAGDLAPESIAMVLRRRERRRRGKGAAGGGGAT